MAQSPSAYQGKVELELASRPAAESVTVLMLALGIGASIAVFSVMNAVLFQLLPVKHASALDYVRMAYSQKLH